MEPAKKRSRSAPYLGSPHYIVNWFSLPERVRSLIIDQMDAKTRCTFASSSAACYKDAIQSENYVYGIEVIEKTPKCFHFNIWQTENKPSYIMTFKMSGEKTVVQYLQYQRKPAKFSLKSKRLLVKCSSIKCQKMPVKWEKIENGTSVDVALRYLKQFLNKFEKNLKFFRTKVNKFPFEKFDLLHAKKLEKIQMLVKDQGDDLMWLDFLNIEMLSKVTDFISLIDAPLKLHEIVQLKADKIQLYTDRLRSTHINKYLRLWVNGKLHKNLRKFHLKLCRYVILRRKLLTKGLDIIDLNDVKDIITKFKLRSPARPGEIAKIHYNRTSFFMVIEEDESEAKKTNPKNAQNVDVVPDEEIDLFSDEEDIFEEEGEDDEESLEDMLAILSGRKKISFGNDYLENFEESDEEFDNFRTTHPCL